MTHSDLLIRHPEILPTPTSTEPKRDDPRPGYHTHASRRTCSHTVYISYIIFWPDGEISTSATQYLVSQKFAIWWWPSRQKNIVSLTSNKITCFFTYFTFIFIFICYIMFLGKALGKFNEIGRSLYSCNFSILKHEERCLFRNTQHFQGLDIVGTHVPHDGKNLPVLHCGTHQGLP